MTTLGARRLTWKERLLGRAATTTPTEPPPVYGAYHGMTLAHWQRSQPHRDYAHELFNQPRFRDLLAVLSNSRPSAIFRQATDIEAAILLGIRQGYDHLLGILLDLPNPPPPPPVDVPMTYGAEHFDINQSL